MSAERRVVRFTRQTYGEMSTHDVAVADALYANFQRRLAAERVKLGHGVDVVPQSKSPIDHVRKPWEGSGSVVTIQPELERLVPRSLNHRPYLKYE